MSQAKLAKAAKVSKGYVSQVFNNPGNLSLVTIVKLAKAAGLKVSVVGYEHSDSEGASSGPINAEVFRLCWERQGKPVDLWSLKQPEVAAAPNNIGVGAFLDNCALGVEVLWKEIQLKEINPVKPFPYESETFSLLAKVNQKSTAAPVRREVGAFSVTLGE